MTTAAPATEITPAITPHITNVVAWDIPSAIGAGERFRITVGIKCSGDCNLAHSDVGVFDQAGVRVGGGTISGEPWPGTTGLYAAEVGLEAPKTVGLHTWNATTPSTPPHTEGSITFGVRVVSSPDHVVTVEAIDHASQTPLSGAHVVLHPYRAVTDERGVATLRVAKGAYRLFVSQTKYVTFGMPIDVTADITARAELHVEPVVERN